jgi:CHAT domain-containing protein
LPISPAIRPSPPVQKDGYKHPFYWASFILVGEVN